MCNIQGRQFCTGLIELQSRRHRRHAAGVGTETGTGYRWVLATEDVGVPWRDGAGALAFAGSMYLLGGWNPYDRSHFPCITTNEVRRSGDGVSWVAVKTNTFDDTHFDAARDWEGRHTFGRVIHGDAMWIVAGDANQGYYQHDVWRSRDGHAWECVATCPPWAPRVLSIVCSFAGRIWVMGGQRMPAMVADDQTEFYDDVWCSADGEAWQQVATDGPLWAPRGMIDQAVVFQERMWILGGGTYDTPDVPERRYYNDVWSTGDGARWRCHARSAPWAPRQYHHAAVWDDQLWVFGGYANRDLDDVWHSGDGANWRELPGTPWAPRHACSVWVYDDALWVGFGSRGATDCWKLVRC